MVLLSHNPYFSRWFSAMFGHTEEFIDRIVTILILVDGFLQYGKKAKEALFIRVTILILVDGFLQ